MNHLKLSVLGVSVAVLGVATFATLKPALGQDPVLGGPVAQTPVRLVYAQPFFLDHPYAHGWRADRPVTSSGWIVAVSTDPAIAEVQNTHDELLFVGAMPVERVNVGAESGVVIGFVPSAAKADGTLAVDLAQEPIYWAKPEILPEALTPEQAQAVLVSTVAQGVVAQRGEAVESAAREGGEAIYLSTAGELYRYAATIVERFSPEETDLVSGLTAQRVR